MAPLDPLYHLVNFLAPALVLGAILALVGPVLNGKSPLARVFIVQFAINSVAGFIALGVGLWFFGRDGKMASYAALVVVAATSQWVGGRSWR